ncbi:hypothetical protein [Levilactobacillus zymae]|uniref:hypothetical protein n=1 Tax=Levilactobacillus zymae TaxID=267363 RepID=UPI0028B5473E|nr:hypothetical protein [Levilactobacillus zymae]MDT6980299.1 hypothetical protein [Levilactobacillus zymae]
MKKLSLVKGLALLGVMTVTGSLGLAPVTASAQARTTPKALRGEWFQTAPEVPYYLKITKKTLRSTVGFYDKGRWGYKQDKVLHLGKKVKVNQTFTISKKPNKAGYWTIHLKQKSSWSTDRMKLKPIKKGHQVWLSGGYQPVTKSFMKKAFGIKSYQSQM